MKAIKITADNIISEIDVDAPLHKSVGAEVGGYIEIVRPRGLKHPFVMVVDEEGLLKNKPTNICGSYLYETHKHGAPIVGDIVIMREDFGPEGADLFGLTDEDIHGLTAFVNNIIAMCKGG